MKKLLCIVLALLFVLSCAAMGENAITTVIYGKIKSANGASTELRILPGDHRPSTYNCPNGTSVMILFEGSAWHKVKVTNGGQTGWVRSAEVSITTRGNSALTYGAAITGGKTVRSSDGFAALRWGPGTEYDEMAKLPNDTYVWIYETSGKWTRVLTEDAKVGYVYTDLLVSAKKKTNWGELVYPIYGFVQVTGKEAVWRKQPNYSGGGAGTYTAGKVLELVGEAGGSFYQFYDFENNRYGYMACELISPEGLTQTLQEAPLYYDNPAIYNTDILWYLPAGKTLKILASDGYTSRVQYDNVIGYISDDMLTY